MLSQSTAVPVTGSHDPIVAAAAEVMLDLGPSRLTMAEVARRAGVSRMTVYRRYRSVGELVSAALTAEMAQVLGQAWGPAGPASPAADVRSRVVTGALQIVDTLGEHTLLQRVLELDPQALQPLLVERIGSGQRLLRDALADALAQGMAGRGGDGSVRDGDPRLMALSIVAMAQPFVVWRRPMSAEHPTGELLAELRRAIDGYLQPGQERVR